MLKRFTLFLVGLLAAPWAAAEGVVYVCPVTGMIDDGVLVVVERALTEAENAGAKAVFFEIDTPGGRVDSAVKIASAIQESDVTTVAYIEGMGAISAGALISFACDHIFMRPGSAIGAATPVVPSSQGMQPTGEKEVSFMRAKMRALAEANGHNPDIAQAMVDKDIELRGYKNDQGEYIVYAGTLQSEGDQAQPAEPGDSGSPGQSPTEKIIETITGQKIPMPEDTEPVKDGGESPPSGGPAEPGSVVYDDGSELVLSKGKLLTMTPGEALKYGVSEDTVEDRYAVKTYLAFGEITYEEIEPTWAEVTYRFLTNPTIAGILLMLGMGGLYFEVRTPGIGLPGIIGVTALVLMFGAHYVLGLTDTIDIVLVLVGVGLILVEVFVLPGFGIAGALGIVALVAGLYLSFLDFTIPEYSWQFDRVGDAVYSLSLAFVLYTVLTIILWKVLPHTPVYNKLVMTGEQKTDEGYLANAEEDRDTYIGKRGVSTSMLRPAGRGRFEGKTLDVVTRGDYIERGVPIEIVGVGVNGYFVDPVEEPEQNEGHA